MKMLFLEIRWLPVHYPILFLSLAFVWFVLFENEKYKWPGFVLAVLALTYYATYGFDYAAALTGDFTWILKPLLVFFGF
ncbi:MAG: hypothetical protein HY393_02920 [Candidatus Diapherotrites archaeon]|nr:hypothetical protein [Candidatus Diapherotrites archaeon]